MSRERQGTQLQKWKRQGKGFYPRACGGSAALLVAWFRPRDPDFGLLTSRRKEEMCAFSATKSVVIGSSSYRRT